MLVSPEILAVLSAAECTGNELRLIGQLARATYVQADKVLKAAGGKWDKRAKAHVFDGDAAEAIDPVLLTGEVQRTKQDFGQFDSPPEVVARLIDLADLKPGMKIMEPSAGVGNIVEAIIAHQGSAAKIFGCEIDKHRHMACLARHFSTADAGGVSCCDFLSLTPTQAFDRVIMNPPFARQADITHVDHAAHFLKPGGRLVAVMSAGITFRTDRRSVEFRDIVAARGGSFEALPQGSFKASGTNVNAVICTFTV